MSFHGRMGVIVDQLPVLVVAVIRISVSRSVQFMDVRFAIHGIVPEGPGDPVCGEIYIRAAPVQTET